MSTLRPKTYVWRGVAVIGLLLIVANPTTLTPAATTGNKIASVSAVLAAVPATPSPSTLTPTKASTSPTSPATGEVTAVRQPRRLTQPWFWMAIAVGVFTFLATTYAAWHWLRHGKFFVMPPDEIALQGLGEARRFMDPDYARVYCLEVSKVIRGYLEQQFQLPPAQLTTEEFLRELVESPATLLASHRLALADFFQHCDLAKSANWRYCRPDLEAMHDCAVEFVRQTARPLSAADQPSTATTTPTQHDSSLTDAHNSPIA
ncbi:MAG: hypothetical protein U1F83_03155 [Verrucomicrobiota bacterium]